MENLGGAGRHTTALVGREVKRTFSEFGGFSTGLPGFQTHEAGRQDFADFGQAVSRLRNGHTTLNGNQSQGVY